MREKNRYFNPYLAFGIHAIYTFMGQFLQTNQALASQQVSDITFTFNICHPNSFIEE